MLTIMLPITVIKYGERHKERESKDETSKKKYYRNDNRNGTDYHCHYNIS